MRIPAQDVQITDLLRELDKAMGPLGNIGKGNQVYPLDPPTKIIARQVDAVMTLLLNPCKPAYGDKAYGYAEINDKMDEQIAKNAELSEKMDAISLKARIATFTLEGHVYAGRKFEVRLNPPGCDKLIIAVTLTNAQAASETLAAAAIAAAIHGRVYFKYLYTATSINRVVYVERTENPLTTYTVDL